MTDPGSAVRHALGGGLRIVPLAALLVLVAAGCDAAGDATAGHDVPADTNARADAGHGTEDGAGADTNAADVTASDDGPLIGSFLVQLVAPAAGAANGGHTAVKGVVYDGPNPELVVWDEAAAAGDCRLLVPRIPVCAVRCGADAACVADDVCLAYPRALDVGPVQVVGLTTVGGATEFVMTALGGVYQPDETLPFPAVAPGAAVRLTAAGGDGVPPFALAAVGVTPLALTSAAADLTLRPDVALVVTYVPEVIASGTRIAVHLDVSHHGGTRGLITCDSADTGAITVAGDLIAGLLSRGVAGFPSIKVTRQVADSARVGQGRIALVVASTVEAAVTVPGVVSCDGDEDCTAPQTCQTDQTCH